VVLDLEYENLRCVGTDKGEPPPRLTRSKNVKRENGPRAEIVMVQQWWYQ
jgi:hypothetical protein